MQAEQIHNMITLRSHNHAYLHNCPEELAIALYNSNYNLQ